MFTIIADAFRWLFSKVVVIFLIVIATVGITITFRYGKEQEQLLHQKQRVSVGVEQVQRELSKAMALLSDIKEREKESMARYASQKLELDSLRQALSSNNEAYKIANDWVNSSTAELEKAKTIASNKANALKGEAESLLSLRRVIREHLSKEPRAYHFIDHKMWVWELDGYMIAFRKQEKVHKEAAESVAKLDSKVKETKAAADAAVQKMLKSTSVSGPAFQKLKTLELRLKQTLQAHEEAKAELANAEQHAEAFRKKGQTTQDELIMLAGRVRWYEHARNEIISAFQASLPQIITLVVVVIGAPPAVKVFWFYIIAPLASFAQPLRYVEADTLGSAVAVVNGNTVEAPVGKKCCLSCRPDWVKAWHPEVKREIQFLWNYHAPAISYVSGLRELTCFSIDADTDGSSVTLGNGNDPLMYILRLDLDNHPGFVLRPNHVVAIAGNLNIRTLWNFFSLHAWICGTFRKISFCGTGTLYVRGYGGVTPIDSTDGPRNVEEDFVIGYDSRSVFRTVRTEIFWPYFRNKTSLFDYSFEGPGLTLYESARPPGGAASGNPFKRSLDTIFNVIGKLLGF